MQEMSDGGGRVEQNRTSDSITASLTKLADKRRYYLLAALWVAVGFGAMLNTPTVLSRLCIAVLVILGLINDWTTFMLGKASKKLAETIGLQNVTIDILTTINTTRAERDDG